MEGPLTLGKGGEMGAEGCRGEGRDFGMGYVAAFRGFGCVWPINIFYTVLMWVGF